MDYGFTEEQIMVRELVRKIALEKVLPVRAELDEKGIFPKDILKVLSDADLCGLYVPEEYGGFGQDILSFCIATEELSRVCGGVGVTFAASALGASPILLFGTEEQKKKYMPEIAKGTKLAAFGLTEANAGSDAGGIETTAVKDGDYYILNGTKQWITNGGEADTYTVVAMTDKKKGARGATAFILEKGTPGFDFGKKEDKMGIRCSATRELVFQNCKINKEQILGKEGMGFIVAMKTLDMTRPGIGAQAVGIAQGALDEAVKYAKERIQFGRPIIALQAIQHMLADMATRIEASRALVYSVAKAMNNGAKDFTKEASMAKLFASDTAMYVTTEAVQILGGYGYMKEYPVEKMMRDAKITQIYEGTNQIQRNQIGLALIKESARR
ncbi:acyl-CoA dehydrogenase [candidate division WOR-1 bacterium RIFOXYA2_FULL_36_21]|uniref:Acyl-CoA dehydrogenase n=1 Tax=candidate division WOR-1 bacterium RIFOXYB2_FULL_36_35 TaxID=1802578 RepID=A0A1F4S427_UNCSA|nr:MAG: acyl-CoA dehydrogenase [candidate division WOR-1 bacterium RIFOXYA2_FULL_36_21]OGC15184.1 MAG: acyl-CoA dehydrogenase [candidate division WOR-1 bacterium RIFOXYB2_FULL_36_35]OGC19043.1 MAG: acyl-CoA dehydrogenase [candidate division WOR-1 bacterium RIFOXYA12_FULL_36_13]